MFTAKYPLCFIAAECCVAAAKSHRTSLLHFSVVYSFKSFRIAELILAFFFFFFFLFFFFNRISLNHGLGDLAVLPIALLSMNKINRIDSPIFVRLVCLCFQRINLF